MTKAEDNYEARTPEMHENRTHGKVTFDKSKVRRDLRPYQKKMVHYIDRGLVSNAFELLDKMEADGVEPDVVTFTMVLRVCSKAFSSEKAVKCWRKMIERDIEPNTVSYTTLIHCFAKEGKVDEAERYYDEMIYKGVPVSHITHGARLAACARAQDYERALKIWTDIRASGIDLPDNLKHNSVLAALAGGGQWEKALEFWMEMKEQRFSSCAMTYNSLILALKTGRQYEQALKLLETAREEGVKLTVVNYTTAISVCGDLKDSNRAEQLFNEMIADGLIPNRMTYTMLLKVYGYTNEIDKARQVFKDLQEEAGVTPTTLMYNEICPMLLRNSLWEEAHELIRDGSRRGILQIFSKHVRNAIDCNVNPNAMVLAFLDVILEERLRMFAQTGSARPLGLVLNNYDKEEYWIQPKLDEYFRLCHPPLETKLFKAKPGQSGLMWIKDDSLQEWMEFNVHKVTANDATKLATIEDLEEERS